MLRRLIAAFHREHGDPLEQQVIERSVVAISAGDPMIPTWLVELDGKPVGYIALGVGYSIEVGGLDAFIDEIYIDPAWRHRGLATAALHHAIEQASRLGIRRLCLEVAAHNKALEDFYARLGFHGAVRSLMYRIV